MDEFASINLSTYEPENTKTTKSHPKASGFSLLYLFCPDLSRFHFYEAHVHEQFSPRSSVEQKQTPKGHLILWASVPYLCKQVNLFPGQFWWTGWLTVSSTNIWGAPAVNRRPDHSSIRWRCCWLRICKHRSSQKRKTTKVSKQSSTVSKINIGSSFQCKQRCK